MHWRIGIYFKKIKKKLTLSIEFLKSVKTLCSPLFFNSFLVTTKNLIGNSRTIEEHLQD